MTGLIHLYIGTGKGKTTAAAGLALRMLGRGGRVVFMQFLKGENSGERAALRCLPGAAVPDLPEQVQFVFQMTEAEKAACAEETQRQFRRAWALAADRQLLILDEMLDAIALGLIPEEQVLSALREKPEGLEVVLTGRNASDALRQLADYVTEMVCEKHPYDRGIPAREGIEL